MRIIAVRGANLASLGPFALELSEAPLSDSRIFAIVGPTGAGKSTLLDAICLALYDRVPRLLEAREAAVNADDLSPNDPRALMRRGSVEAFAEVDFIDREGQQCRARWDAWRARKRADGRIQTQRMSLVDLSHGQDLTEATKTETLRRIEDRLGLSFDEFRRAVLLAQGDFSAFLRAPADERANLLEKMTGTQLFGALSRAAHQRCRVAAESLAVAEAEQAAVAVLSDEDLAALLTERSRRTERRTSLAQLRVSADAVVRWYDALSALETAAQDADRALQRAREAVEAADGDRRTLSRAEAAAQHRAPYEAWMTAHRAAGLAVARTKEAHAAEEAATGALGDAREAIDTAEAHNLEVRDRHAQQAVELARARELDGRAAETRAAADAAARRLATLTEKAHETRSALDAALDRHESAAAELKTAERWLAEHADLKVIAGQWPSVEQGLLRTAQLAKRAAEVHAAREAADRRLTEASTAAAEATSASQSAAAALDAATAELQTHQASLAEIRADVPPRDRRDAMESLAELRAGLERLRTLLPNARRLDRRIREETRARRVALAHAKQVRKGLDQAREQQRTVRANLERAIGELTRAEAVQTVASRRDELLTEGEPCPLCGSVSHPLAHCEPTDHPGLSSLRARRTRLDNELTQVRQDLDNHRAALRTHRAEAKDALVRGEEAQEDLQLLIETWSAGRDALKLVWLRSALLTQRGVHKLYLEIDESPIAKDAKDGIAAAIKGLDAARADLGSWAEREDATLQAVESALVRRDEAEAVHKATASRETAQQAERASAQHQRDHLDERQRATEDECRQTLSSLSHVLGPADQLERATEAPDDVRTELDARIQTFEARKADAEVRAERVKRLNEALQQARTAAERAADNLTEARQHHEQAAARVEALAEQRAACLGGQTIEAYERVRAEAAQAAEDAVDGARDRLREAQATYATAAGRHQDSVATQTAAENTRRDTEARLHAALAGSDFSLDDLRVHLEQHSSDWQRQERLRLQALGDALTRAQADADAAARRLREHRAAQTPAVDRERAEADRRSAEADHEDEIVALGRIEEQLRRNAEATDARRRLDARALRLRRDLEEWSELNAVIGSADGKKLRAFAQGLTLESLVAQANLHLDQLRPRYQLDRVPGQDMDLMVIDRDLGDERRGLSSLSGGETFLVSLALALALSTLSAKDVQIESLFVDEGFGALDAEALEVALATLDQLQAEGRTIGLISHIPDLAERIGYRVEVVPTGPGTSEVRVHGV